MIKPRALPAAQPNRLFCKALDKTNGGFEEDKQMKLKEAIQSANLHASTAHAQAKADAVERKTEQPRPTLTFDGCGINGPDEYRSRLATFTNREEGKRWGHLFAAAPELLEVCERLHRMSGEDGVPLSLSALAGFQNDVFRITASAIAKAKKGQQ